MNTTFDALLDNTEIPELEDDDNEELTHEELTLFLDIKDGLVDADGTFISHVIFRKDNSDYFVRLNFETSEAEVFSNGDNIDQFAVIYFLALLSYEDSEGNMVDLLHINPDSSLDFIDDNYKNKLKITDIL